MSSLIRCAALLAALGDDVGGAELPGDRLAGLVPRHRDHPLGAQLGRGQDAAQADRAVADDDRRAARLARRPTTAACQPVAITSESVSSDGISAGVGHAVGLDQAALGLVDHGVLRLAARR